MAIEWLWIAVYKEYPVTESEQKCANTRREMIGIRQRYANKIYDQSRTHSQAHTQNDLV